MNQQEMVAGELKAASASLMFAINAIASGNWAAAEQSMVDGLQRKRDRDARNPSENLQAARPLKIWKTSKRPGTSFTSKPAEWGSVIERRRSRQSFPRVCSGCFPCPAGAQAGES